MEQKNLVVFKGEGNLPKDMKVDLIATRHRGCRQNVIDLGLATPDTLSFRPTKISEVRNRIVIGKLPFWLACHTFMYIDMVYNIPKDRKWEELDAKELITFLNFPLQGYLLCNVAIEPRFIPKEVIDKYGIPPTKE